MNNLIQHKKAEILLLLISSFFCLFLSIFRVFQSGTIHYLFLIWNLFLAFVPWLLSRIITDYPKLQEKRRWLVFLLITWLLFFPNAPYILTDLFHLRLNSSVPIWYDLVLILSYAWVGLIFGYMSLWNLESLLRKSYSEKTVTILSSVLLFLSGFGIYIGRFLRWNSWDIIRDPFGLFSDIGSRFIYPFDHLRTWGVTIFMGLFLNLVYWSFRIIRARNKGSI